MRKLVVAIAVVSLHVLSIQAQTNKTFFLGHSLVNFNMPNMVNKLSIAGSKSFAYSANVGNGANLLYHWNNPTSGQGDQWNTTLPEGGFENFILTEAVPLQGHLEWSSTYRIADSLYQFASLHNPNIKYYIYETWHCTNSGNGSTSGEDGYPCDWDPESVMPWRQRLNVDLAKWESIADSVNAIHPESMWVIPAGQALGRLTDSIASGAVPGLTSINDMFTDNIHMDTRGNYFIACVMYAVIHGESPQGLPNQLTDEWGGLYTIYPTVEQASMMQQIAWETVCAYDYDGVECLSTAVNEYTAISTRFSLFPNPSAGSITITSESNIKELSIYNAFGELIYCNKTESTAHKIDLSQQSKGIYFITVSFGKSIATQKIVLE